MFALIMLVVADAILHEIERSVRIEYLCCSSWVQACALTGKTYADGTRLHAVCHAAMTSMWELTAWVTTCDLWSAADMHTMAGPAS